MNDLSGIDTDCRLIQDQDFRFMDDGLSDSNELPISFGQLGNGGFWIFIQTAGMNDFFNPVSLRRPVIPRIVARKRRKAVTVISL